MYKLSCPITGIRVFQFKCKLNYLFAVKSNLSSMTALSLDKNTFIWMPLLCILSDV